MKQVFYSGFPLPKYGTATLYVGDPGSVGVIRHLNVCTRCFPLALVFGRAKRIGGSLCDGRFMVLGTENFIFGRCWFCCLLLLPRSHNFGDS